MKITLRKPPSINHLYGFNRLTGGRYMLAKGKAWYEESGYVVRGVWRGKAPITAECEVYVKLYTCRFRDVDNALKCSLDLLQNAKVIENDNLVRKVTAERIKVKHLKDEKLEIII